MSPTAVLDRCDKVTAVSRPDDTRDDARDLPRTGSVQLGWVGIAALVLVGGSSFFAGFAVGAVRIALACALLALVLYLNLVRPVVRLRGDRLELVNALSLTSVPLAAIERYDIRLVLMIWAGERRVSSAAIGRSMRSLKAEVRGKSRARPRGLTAALAPEYTPSTPSLLDVVHSLLRPAIDDARRRAELEHIEVGEVRRTWAWPWIALLLVLLVAFAASFFLHATH